MTVLLSSVLTLNFVEIGQERLVHARLDTRAVELCGLYRALKNKYARPCNARTEMYAGHVACMLSPGEPRLVCAARSIKVRKKTGQTDGRTSDRYITLTARRAA